MGDFRIEPAKPEDAAAMLAYLKQLGGETDNLTFGGEGRPLTVQQEADCIQNAAGSPNQAMFVAKIGDQVVGDISLNRLPRRMSHRGELGIGVLKAYWSQGIGSALMQKIVDFARDNGLEQLNLQVRSDNVRAIRLYEKFGFRRLCTFPAFFKVDGQPVDFELMNLYLKEEV